MLHKLRPTLAAVAVAVSFVAGVAPAVAKPAPRRAVSVAKVGTVTWKAHQIGGGPLRD
jgi:hypothetical protein